MEELGTPYRLALVDRTTNAHQSSDYLRLNPNGKIPVLVEDRPEGELVLYETAAIVLHLLELHPRPALMPPPGSAARAHFYKWLVWFAATLQAEMPLYFYAERWADTPEGAASVKAHAQARIAALIDQVEAELARHGGPWLLGETFTALDLYALMLCRWTRGMARPARTLPNLGPYLQRVLARPAVQRSFEQEGIGAPLV
jgi:glutathione S-transferase